MPAESTCPTPETLDDLLSNRLSSARAEEIRGHLSRCPTCQAKLARGPAEKPAFAFLDPPRADGEIGWLGPYRVVGVLGEGGMGIVFDAVDPALDRPIALKVMRPEYLNDNMRERFLREAKVVASLPADHVVAIFAVNEANGVPYLAMERLVGETLEARLKRDRWLPVTEVLTIAREAAAGLVVAHERGLVHRDVKPANLWLEAGPGGRFKRVKLIDFGIARPVGGDSGLTVHGQVIGTPTYMAPEQAAGHPVDGRADLYSLGCVLYRMVTGQTPFDPTAPMGTLAVLEATIKGEAPRVGEFAPQLSPQLAAFIQKLLAREPIDRPASAGVVVDEFTKLEQEERRTDGLTNFLMKSATTGNRRAPRRASTLGVILGVAAILVALAVGGVAAVQRLWPGADKQPNAGVEPTNWKGPPIKVGLLFSQTGPLHLSEFPINDAANLAIEEINQGGGVLGRKLDVVVEDGASDERVFAQQAEKLLEQDKVDVIFGCWSSGGRKRVAAVCVKYDRLLFYPVNYEGLEQSNNVIYLGGSTNQSLIPLVRWVYTDLGKRRFFIVGSEEIYSHSSVEILQHELTELGARVVGVEYVPVGETFNMKGIAAAVNDAKPDFIVNLIDGYQANLALAQALRAAGIQPTTAPTAWASISEPELSQFHARDIVGDYTVGCYFESLDLPENKEFIARFRKRFAEFRRINDAMQSAYTGVQLWKKAVEQANSTDTGPVRTALRGMSITGPEGKIKIDSQNLHAWRIARVGQVVAEGPLLQFEMKFQSPAPVPPVVFPDWKSREEWQVFQEKLYKGWGNSWEKHR